MPPSFPRIFSTHSLHPASVTHLVRPSPRTSPATGQPAAEPPALEDRERLDTIAATLQATRGMVRGEALKAFADMLASATEFVDPQGQAQQDLVAQVMHECLLRSRLDHRNAISPAFLTLIACHPRLPEQGELLDKLEKMLCDMLMAKVRSPAAGDVLDIALKLHDKLPDARRRSLQLHFANFVSTSLLQPYGPFARNLPTATQATVTACEQAALRIADEQSSRTLRLELASALLGPASTWHGEALRIIDALVAQVRSARAGVYATARGLMQIPALPAQHDAAQQVNLHVLRAAATLCDALHPDDARGRQLARHLGAQLRLLGAQQGVREGDYRVAPYAVAMAVDVDGRPATLAALMQHVAAVQSHAPQLATAEWRRLVAVLNFQAHPEAEDSWVLPAGEPTSAPVRVPYPDWLLPFRALLRAEWAARAAVRGGERKSEIVDALLGSYPRLDPQDEDIMTTELAATIQHYAGADMQPSEWPWALQRLRALDAMETMNAMNTMKTTERMETRRRR